MARLRRLEIAGQVHLVMQRGHPGQPALGSDDDRRDFAEALAFCARRWGVAVHAYALTEQQALLLVTPAAAGSLGRMMQQLNRRFAGAVGSRTGRGGSLWDGRYRATVVEPGGSVLAGMCLVEGEPVAEGLVSRGVDWPWSSARHHAGLGLDPLVSDHASYWHLGNTPFEREERYRTQLEALLSASQRLQMLEKARGGWPIGSSRYLAEMASLTERRLSPRPRGRPPNPVPK